MTTTHTDTREVEQITDAKTTGMPAKESSKTLAELAKSIRNDANQDSLTYLLRSNTSHDGE